MDKTDHSILNFLQENGRKPYTEIAQQLGISEGTVRNRVNRLIEDGVVRIVGLVDPVSFGLDAPAIIGISVAPAELEKAAAQIAAFPEVGLIVEVSGEYDLIVEVICRDREHLAVFLNDRLSSVPGIVKTETFLVLRTFKMVRSVIPDQSAAKSTHRKSR
jgi:Lrp/AsnC family transcriptional regulator for asnA, asnC and gidA